jgi:DNA repair protein RadD
MSALRPLYPHQERALEASRASLKAGKRRPMVQAPCGFGKTLMACHIIQRALDKGKRVAFVVPKLSLIDQTIAAFAAEGIKAVGVMQGQHPLTDGEQPVQVISAQTLGRRSRPNVDLVIIDEAHELHASVLAWMADETWAHVPFIGLSATPWSRGLGCYYDDLIIGAATADLIRSKHLASFLAFAPSEPDLSAIRTVAGDFHQGELGEAVDKPKIIGDIVETWIKRGDDRPTFCFCVNRAHARHISERFIESGIAAEYMDGQTPREQRNETFDRFRSGHTKIICNVGVLTLGMDLDVRCIVDARPTKSRILFVQTIGRGLRTAEGKRNLLILDHAGNHLRLGTVDSITQDYLDDGKERQASARSRSPRAPLPRLCDECRAVLPHGASGECPGCGAPIFSKTMVQAAAGELVELGSMRSGRRTATIDEKARFHGELKWFARERGHKAGWIAHKFKERFGTWPNDWRIRTAEPRAPSLETRNWIKSRSIAWAKSGGAAHG